MIDTNLYWFDEQIFEDETLLDQFINELPKHYDLCGYVKVNDDGQKQIVIEKPIGSQNLNYVQGEYKLEKLLQDLDTAKVDKAILKVPGCGEWMSLAMCKRFNDGMYAYAKESKGRLIPLAVVPPVASFAVLEELDRCFHTLGFKGVQLCAHYGNKYLDDAIYAGFFEKLNALHATVYIHHTPIPVDYTSFLDYDNLRRSYGRCVDQMVAVSRELFSGFFERYPNLKFVHSMLGGGFFAFYDMMMPHTTKQESVTRFHTDVTSAKKHLKENIFFEMSHSQPWGKKQLECAVEVLGSDHILWGSSYPVRKEWLLEGTDFIKTLDISDEDKELILGKNAEIVYKIGE